MSTRATYKIDGHTFYIHHDGYPEGAAEYFRNALEFPEKAKERAPNASFADDFFRANPRAEHTPGHDSHADTEYRYTVITKDALGPRKMGLVAENRTLSRGQYHWREFFRGTVQEFEHRHRRFRESANDDYEARVSHYEAQGMTRSDAQAVVDAEDIQA